MRQSPRMLQWEPLGERALLLRWGDTLDERTNARVHAAAATLRAAALSGVEDIAPAYASLLLRFDPAPWRAMGYADVHRALRAHIEPLLAKAEASPLSQPRELLVGVCYGGECGPDLAEVAHLAGLSEQQVIERHCAPVYQVAMLGFAPGFPYLLGLDPVLHVPRRANPRICVPAGSVAIGGTQTGIYPRDLPGGWQLIGRTPMQLFDASRRPPGLLQPGDKVRFEAVGPGTSASTGHQAP